MKNNFDELSGLGTAEERISQLEYMSTETSKMEKQRGQKGTKNNQTEYPRTVGQLT